MKDMATDLQTFLAGRKVLFRSIRLRLKREVLQQIREAHQAVIPTSTNQHQRATEATVVGDDDEEEEEEEKIDTSGVDEEVLENENVAIHEEPECWKK